MFARSRAILDKAGVTTPRPQFIGSTSAPALAVNRAASLVAPLDFPAVPNRAAVPAFPGPVAIARGELAALRFQQAQDKWLRSFQSAKPPAFAPQQQPIDPAIFIDWGAQVSGDPPPYILPPGGELLSMPGPIKAVLTGAGWVVKVASRVIPVAKAGYYTYKGLKWLDSIEPGPTPPARTRYELNTNQLLYEWPGGQWSTEPPP